MAKILLVEDDPKVADSVSDALLVEHHVVELVTEGQEAYDRLKLYSYDLVILDWGLPDRSGIDVCLEYRNHGGRVPVLMLTGRDKATERVQGLDSGADDYLAKPFNMQELLARVRALLRRPATLLPDLLTVQDVTVDLKSSRVTRGEKEIALLPKEFALLAFLMRHCEQVFDVNDLLEKVWHSESDSTEDAVRQCVTRLRKKIDVDGQPSFITTVKNLGYRVDKNPSK